jgi:hypothetical protein
MMVVHHLALYNLLFTAAALQLVEEYKVTVLHAFPFAQVV